MAKKKYSKELCRELTRTVKDSGVSIPYRPKRYDAGELLDIKFTMAWPEVPGSGRFRIEKFVGGGFAGQVYRCVLESVDSHANIHPLKPGGIYGVVDHTRRHMEPSGSENRRRLDPVLVIKEMLEQGFEFVDYSNLHFRADDELEYEVGRKSVTGNTDRFTLMFKKPEAP